MRGGEDSGAGAAVFGGDGEGEHGGIVNENAEISKISAFAAILLFAMQSRMPGCAGYPPGAWDEYHWRRGSQRQRFRLLR